MSDDTTDTALREHFRAWSEGTSPFDYLAQAAPTWNTVDERTREAFRGALKAQNEPLHGSALREAWKWFLIGWWDAAGTADSSKPEEPTADDGINRAAVRAARQGKGLSIAACARQIGISETSLSMAERGQHVGKSVRAAIARWLDATTTPEPTPQPGNERKGWRDLFTWEESL